MTSIDLTHAGKSECPCRARIEARLLERFKAQEPTARGHMVFNYCPFCGVKR